MGADWLDVLARAIAGGWTGETLPTRVEALDLSALTRRKGDDGMPEPQGAPDSFAVDPARAMARLFDKLDDQDMDTLSGMLKAAVNAGRREREVALEVPFKRVEAPRWACLPCSVERYGVDQASAGAAVTHAAGETCPRMGQSS